MRRRIARSSTTSTSPNAPHIDSKVLEKAEAREDVEADVPEGNGQPKEAEDDDAPVPKLTRQEQAERLRQIVDTVGEPGKPGEAIQNVISVGMLSEGWDTKTVTHIMGLRAFSSQLLCEQVVGRGLRRTSYEVKASDGLFEPEYVNIFGVPFTFLPPRGWRRGGAASAATEEQDRGPAGQAGVRDLLAQRRPHRALVRAPAEPRTIHGFTAPHPGRGYRDARRAGARGGRQAGRHALDRHPHRRAGAPVPRAEDRLRDGARRLRPDAPRLVLSARATARSDRGVGRALSALRSRADFAAALQ